MLTVGLICTYWFSPKQESQPGNIDTSSLMSERTRLSVLLRIIKIKCSLSFGFKRVEKGHIILVGIASIDQNLISAAHPCIILCDCVYLVFQGVKRMP